MKLLKMLETKDGLNVLTLDMHGYEWGMPFVNGGWDYVIIDTGDNSAREDF